MNTRPAMVMVLKRLRRRGHGLKYHLTDWESWESNFRLLLTQFINCIIYITDLIQFSQYFKRLDIKLYMSY